MSIEVRQWISCMLLVAMLSAVGMVRAQVNICYNFDDLAGNSRPVGWGALPNLDYNYVGVIQYDNTAQSGAHALHIKGAICYALMPDEGIDYAADGVWMSFWYYLSMNTTRIEVGYLTDATDTSTFHLLKSFHYWAQVWCPAVVDLSSVPAGARVAFRSRDIFVDDGTFWIDDVYITSDPCDVDISSLQVTSNRADSVRLEWDVAGSPDVTIGIGSNTYSPVGNSITVPRFFPETSYGNNYYALRFSSSCDVTQNPSPCRPQGYLGYFKVLPYREAPCIAVTDIYSSMAVPSVGTPVEPYMELGPRSNNQPGVTGIFAGSHAVNTNPGSDGGGMMVFPQTIPPGDNVTLRLGNRLGDWESASMLYTITVDTNEAEILVMKYTMAMAYGTFQGTEEAHHSDTLHPAWFCIELMDDTLGQLPPAACNRFYIDAWDNSGWDEMNNTYKRRNFTGMAFDLSPYHGQRVKLRITATDGAVNNRWCYSYYNIECLKRHEVIGACAEGADSVTITMPYGFSYGWRRDGQEAIISNERSITVPVDSALYHCELTDRFNTACSSVVSRLVLPRPQRWESDTVVENQLPYTWHGVVFTAAGDTSIVLPAVSGGCDTTLTLHLHVWPNQDARQVLRVCPDKWPVVWQGHTFDGPDSVEVTYTDMHGADSVVTYVTVEAPAYELADTVVICPWRAFVYDGVGYGGPVSFDTVLATVDGCDSLLHVTLMARDSAFAPQAWHSVDGVLWADTVPIVLCSNEQLLVVDSTQGAQSWHWVLGDSDSSESRAATFTFVSKDSVETVELTLDVVSAYGCHDTVMWPVVVFPAPEAAFEWTPEHPMDVDAQTQLVNNTVPDSCSWLWLIGEDSLTAFAPYYRWQGYTAPGDVDVMLKAMLTMQHDTITHTCTDTAVRQVSIVTCFLQFPCLVTPNGDGVNDRWEVVNLVEMGLYPQNEVWIYNQWGVRVFHAKDITDSDQFWDPNDLPCPDGTYYFRFMARNKYGIVRQNGVIEVLR